MLTHCDVPNQYKHPDIKLFVAGRLAFQVRGTNVAQK